MTPLNQWARDFGYNDYDTYIRSGGSVGEAMRDISRRISRLVAALKQLQPEISSEALRATETAEADDDPMILNTPDKPADPDNAHIQGAEFGDE